MTEYYRPDYTPEWFDLKNYEGLQDMMREEMYYLVKKRRTFYYVVSSSHTLPKSSYEESFKKVISDADTLLDVYKTENKSIADFSFGDYLQLQEVNYKLGLLPLLEELRLSKDTFMEYAKIQADKDYLGDDDYNIIDDLSWAELLRFKKMFEDDCSNIFDISKPIPLLFSDAVTINLNYNDDKIIDDMRMWLKARRENQSKKRLSDAKLKKLIDNMVIPCMDLISYSKCKGISYTNAQLGDMLFPKVDFDRAEKVRKKVKPEAEKYLDSEECQNIL